LRAIYLLLIVFVANVASSQNPEGMISASENKAFALYNASEYHAVIQMLGESPGNLESLYLVKMSLVNLGRSDAATLEKLIEKNPGFPLNIQASFVAGKYYFYKNILTKSEQYFKAIDPSAITKKDRSDYYFFRGYLALQKLRYKVAQDFFKRSANLKSEKDPQLTYYQGYISYQLNQNEASVNLMNQLIEDAEFGNSAVYYLAKIKLEQNQYDEVISLTQSHVSEIQTIPNAEFHQLVGEAYALKDQAGQASRYFDKAIELHPGKPSAALFYQAGVAKFKINSRERAIEYLTEAGIRSGEYAHLSAFQLARIYVASQQYVEASAAYISASVSSDSSIRQESYYKAGKLLVDQENYTEGINFLEDYLKYYPNGNWVEESNDLLAEAYLRTSNYDLAINHLQEVGIISNSSKRIYQKSSFQKGILLFNDGHHQEAIKWFNESVKYPLDTKISDDAYFNSAESSFAISDFKEAIESYNSQKNPHFETEYGLGYSYYNLSNYQQSIVHFQQFLETSPTKSLRDDAMLRLADCYYATKSYEKALKTYTELFESMQSSYVQFQIGMVHKGMDNAELAFRAFEMVEKLPEESFKDDAIFEMAMIRFERAEFERADFYFSSLISKYPNSNWIPESYLKRGLSRLNSGLLEESKEDFEFVIKSHINSNSAFNALLGLQELKSRGIEVKNIDRYIEKYRQANPNSESIETIDFEYAKASYFNFDYANATKSFGNFIKNYPESSFLFEALYYLGDSYYRSSQLEDARNVFVELSSHKTEYDGRVFFRLGEIFFALEQYDEALKAFSKLTASNFIAKDNYNGLAGKMKTYMACDSLSKAIEVAEEIIKLDWKPLNAERNSILVKGNAYRKLHNNDSAKRNFNRILAGSDLISANAWYALADIQFAEGNYKESLELLFKFNTDFGSYQDLVDQSYLLIAENYIQLEELFQAKATLRSIIQHTKNEQIRGIAQEKLSAIENQSLNDSTAIRK
jgi:tetratricopeptide (TPR) repeat protein